MICALNGRPVAFVLALAADFGTLTACDHQLLLPYGLSMQKQSPHSELSHTELLSTQSCRWERNLDSGSPGHTELVVIVTETSLPT